MGNHVSIDEKPQTIEDLFKDYPYREQNFFSSNIKIWKFEESSSDQCVVSPLNFTMEFSSFNPHHCYVVLHTFNKGEEFQNQDNQRKAIKLTSHSLLQLAASTVNLTLPGLENRFCVNDLQNFFFSKCSNIGFREKLTLLGESLNGFSYCVYVWHGKNASTFLQSSSTTAGLDLDRKLLLNEKVVRRAFSCGEPSSICNYYHNDIPSFTSESILEIKKTSSSSLAICMTLFQYCHLFRQLIHNPETISQLPDNVGSKDVAFRALLQLPPTVEITSSFQPAEQENQIHDNDIPEYMASPAASPIGSEESDSYHTSDESTEYFDE
ncbi:predicted protein [Naegleria gruberi]|uniref:Predicted protein n=1 Tax=Naegleria gruberi TaxID=5762 RepID=D2VHR4_NAEGR|nr:uncharacterized protein NAEGRDRAFT_68418 [Naegleria gruberi]EFC43640.1 predicted protein [Naegleria gruberi]|eukprot:XP_002676384.1 predicted protein [Naegleria gruberi strain NEG-M]